MSLPGKEKGGGIVKAGGSRGTMGLGGGFLVVLGGGGGVFGGWGWGGVGGANQQGRRECVAAKTIKKPLGSSGEQVVLTTANNCLSKEASVS